MHSHVTVQSIQDMARERIRIDLANQELYLAQIIKMNPEINLVNYRVCHRPIEHEGSFGESFWLEEIKSTF